MEHIKALWLQVDNYGMNSHKGQRVGDIASRVSYEPSTGRYQFLHSSGATVERLPEGDGGRDSLGVLQVRLMMARCSSRGVCFLRLLSR